MAWQCRSVLLIVVAAVALMGCASPVTLLPGQPVDAPVTPTPALAPDSTWYRVYFTQPALTANLANPSGGIPEQIAASFDAAQYTIDLAIYQFDLPPLAAALVRAQARGVQVRVVTDSDSLDMDGLRTLAQAGVPVVPDNRQPIMHDKLWGS